jgi:hypothetical protein
MNRAFLISAIMLYFLSPTLLAAPQVTIEGSIVNHKGQPFAGVSIHASCIIGAFIENGETNLTVRSDANGKFSFTGPSGIWLIRVDPDELLIRGYACFPDYSQPVFMDVQLQTFEVIPTRPQFSTPQFVERKLRHTVTFDTTALAPIATIRTYDLQWSTDHEHWKTFASVSLLNSPLEIEDPDIGPARKFYRAVLVEKVE